MKLLHAQTNKQKGEQFCFPIIRSYKNGKLLLLEDTPVKSLSTPVLAAFLLKKRSRSSVGRRKV